MRLTYIHSTLVGVVYFTRNCLPSIMFSPDAGTSLEAIQKKIKFTSSNCPQVPTYVPSYLGSCQISQDWGHTAVG